MSVLFGAILFAVAAKLLQAWLSTAKGKGKVGEMLVGAVLGRLGPEWTVLNDLTFVMDGESTQIDHVVISRKGVFVIETKNYGGMLFGTVTDAKWTQVMGSKKTSFQNPLRQNYRHQRFLAENLGVKETAIVPMVVFLGGAKFPKGLPTGVYFPNQVLSQLKSYEQDMLNNAQVEGIRLKLARLGETTSSKTRQHLELLKEHHQ